MTLLMGKSDRGREMATKVREQCLEKIEDRRGGSYWEFAALAEAGLVCRDLKQAGEWYARAAEKSSGRCGDVDSSRRDARLMLQHWNEDPTCIRKGRHVPTGVT